MIGGYVLINEKLFSDIIKNSGTPGSHKFENCYDIAKEAASTKKIIIGDTGIARFYLFSMYVEVGENEEQIILTIYGDGVVTCTFTSSDKNNYTILGG